MLQWVYSKVQYFSEYLKKWDDTLEQDIQEKEIIEAYIQQMESPFGFLDQVKNEVENQDDQEEDDGQPKSKLQEMV